jgi:hypothetical protein
MLEVVNSIQMHHARLLYIVSELFAQNRISEDQKLALKFGIFNDDSKLLDFYFEHMTQDKPRSSHHQQNAEPYQAPFEEEDRYSAASVLVEKQTLLRFCDRLCDFTRSYMNESTTSGNSR